MNLYKSTLRSFLSEFASSLRKSRGMTQEEMAEKLRITGRAYSDLERGIYCFSTVALIFLLLMLKEDEMKEFLTALRGEITKAEGCVGLVCPQTIPAFFIFPMRYIWRFSSRRAACSQSAGFIRSLPSNMKPTVSA